MVSHYGILPGFLSTALDGAAAVIFFFVLSGFVLSLPYFEGRRLDLADFYIRRVFRIHPAAIASLIFAAIPSRLRRVFLSGTAALAQSRLCPIQQRPVVASRRGPVLGHFAGLYSTYRHRTYIEADRSDHRRADVGNAHVPRQRGTFYHDLCDRSTRRATSKHVGGMAVER